MALGTLSVCLSVIVLNFHHRGGAKRVPRWARILIIQYCGKLFGFRFKRICPPRVRECPNNYRTPNHTEVDPDSAEMMEVQNILPQGERPHRQHLRNHDSYIINETMHYHNVDVAHIKHSNISKEITSEEHYEEATKEWQMLAKVLDSIFFALVSITMFVSACTILLSPWYLHDGSKLH